MKKFMLALAFVCGGATASEISDAVVNAVESVSATAPFHSIKVQTHVVPIGSRGPVEMVMDFSKYKDSIPTCHIAISENEFQYNGVRFDGKVLYNFIAAHELTHCYRALSNTMNLKAVQHEEQYADIGGLAWAKMNAPEEFYSYLEYAIGVRSKRPGTTHDTRAVLVKILEDYKQRRLPADFYGFMWSYGNAL